MVVVLYKIMIRSIGGIQSNVHHSLSMHSTCSVLGTIQGDRGRRVQLHKVCDVIKMAALSHV